MTKVKLGIFYMLICSISFSLMGYFTKTISSNVPSSQILFFRCIFGLIILIPICVHKSISIIGENRKAMLSRGFTGSIGAISIFYAISSSPIAEATALFRTSALFIPFLAWIILGEKLRILQIIFAMIGFMGTLLILKPNFNYISLGLLMALIGSFFTAYAWVSVRGLANKENTFTIIIYFLAICATLCLVCFGKDFVVPNLNQAYILLIVSIFGTIGQIFLTNAYKHANAAVITPIGYSEIIFVTILGFIGFNELPDYLSFIGMALIIVNSFLIIKISDK